MRVLLLGGTGSIGSAVLSVLQRRGHHVLALARSEGSAARVVEAGAEVLPGDLRAPEAWAPRLAELDAVVHAASTFDEDMPDIDRRLIDALVHGMTPGTRLIYTGGCWLYGATGNRVADEASPFDPQAEFAWMVEALDRLKGEPSLETVIVHPAMVYSRDGGVFARFAEEARAGGPVRVVGSESIRWPLVHREDLAELYGLALETGQPGEAYNGSADAGVQVGSIARAIARRHRIDEVPDVVPVSQIVAELGSWASGYAIDQQMTGAKAKKELGWTPRHLDPLLWNN